MLVISKMFLINSIVHDLDKLDVLRALMFGISWYFLLTSRVYKALFFKGVVIPPFRLLCGKVGNIRIPEKLACVADAKGEGDGEVKREKNNPRDLGSPSFNSLPLSKPATQASKNTWVQNIPEIWEPFIEQQPYRSMKFICFFWKPCGLAWRCLWLTVHDRDIKVISLTVLTPFGRNLLLDRYREYPRSPPSFDDGNRVFYTPKIDHSLSLDTPYSFWFWKRFRCHFRLILSGQEPGSDVTLHSDLCVHQA